ncbi:MAG: twin-arginine translocase subunit TatC [Bacteroidetes bacterium]|nr:twin-arginine translocase subunit TatC [Bacteroidota bacterium]
MIQETQPEEDNTDNIIDSSIDDVERNDDGENDKNMSFLEHIDEMRKRIIYVIIFLVISCVFVAANISTLMQDVFLAPALNANLLLQNLQPFGQPILYFKVIFIAAAIITMPFFLWQFWIFLSPALYKDERKWVGSITIITSISFLCGVLFSYFVLIPSMLAFAANFGSELIANNIDANEYFSFISMILLASGLLFELPMVSFVLSKFSIVSSEFLRKYRRHAYVVILILAAVLTPTPDPVSQLIFASPIVVLYEISIYVAKAAQKNNN